MTLEQIEKLTALQMGRRSVSADQRFMEDLGAESADIVNIIATVEDKFNISFDHKDLAAVGTVRDLFELAAGETQ